MVVWCVVVWCAIVYMSQEATGWNFLSQKIMTLKETAWMYGMETSDLQSLSKDELIAYAPMKRPTRTPPTVPEIIIPPPPEYRDRSASAPPPVSQPIAPPPEYRDKAALIAQPPKYRDRSESDPRSMNVVSLKALAKESGLKGYSLLRKGDLINLLKLSLVQQADAVATPSTQLQKAMSFEMESADNRDPLGQLTATRDGLFCLLRSELQELKGLKFSETLQITFEKKLQENKTTYMDSLLQL